MKTNEEQLLKKIEKLEQENKQLSDDLRKAQAKYLNMRQSFSWRLIKPVHKIGKVFGKQSSMVRFGLDRKEYQNGELLIMGWIFGVEKDIEHLSLTAKFGKRQMQLPLSSGLERDDLGSFYTIGDSSHAGFFYQGMLVTRRKIRLTLHYTIDGVEYTRSLGHVKRSLKESLRLYGKLFQWNNIKKAGKFIVRGDFKGLKEALLAKTTPGIASVAGKTVMYEALDKYFYSKEEKMPSLKVTEPVDLIVPVYNGLRFFPRLFKGIENTSVPYRLIIVDDCSPEEASRCWLEEYAAEKENVLLLRNEQNLGFVGTVNRALKEAKGHVVLLNTDIELPSQWLERLIAPILFDPKVATVTPFTNSGTICSFPQMGVDNEIFNELDVEVIDSCFREIKPRYTKLPTGVGFCMALNKAAVEKVGLLDAETFGKGYGEENDWCQRAIHEGFVNVMCENLYVFHNHGGSFVSEEKAALLEHNLKALAKKHPNYNRDVALYFENEKLYELRDYLSIKVCEAAAPEEILYFNHALGGGANAYLVKRRQQELNEDKAVFEIQYDYRVGEYVLFFSFRTLEARIRFSKWEDLIGFLKKCSINTYVINELVTYPELYRSLKDIASAAKEQHAYLQMLMHDFYAVCPVVNLLNDERKFCHLPDAAECDRCLAHNKAKNYLNYRSMETWRENWAQFLAECDEVRCFSENTKNYVQQVYGDLKNITLVPHKVDYLIPFKKKYKTTGAFNIGVLGALSYHKGGDIIKSLLAYIEEHDLNVNIVHLGSSEEKIESEHFIETGIYTPQEIPSLLLKHDVDMIFIASVWPETFSYTTDEAIRLNMPVAVFDFGAPADRVAKYSKGLVLKKMDTDYIMDQFLQNRERFCCPYNEDYKEKKVLFVIEEKSFASRYRIDHLMEQLLWIGYPVECILSEEADSVAVNDYHTAVIYRCHPSAELSRMITKFHSEKKKVWFEIDDYIFDFHAISDIEFVRHSKDADYKKYCDDMREVMEQCDGYLTSTEKLRTVIQSYYPDRPVLVHRNVASYEMRALSKVALQNKCANDPNVVLGYFSGSWTHNADFLMIEDVLVRIMKEFPEVKLVLGGVLDVPKSLQANYKKIKTYPFVSWKKLPQIISTIDIDLMPLEDTLFHSCKSENKWTEAGLVGVTTISSRNDELAQIIGDGVDGVLCREDQWYEKIKELITNSEERHRIAKNVENRVWEEYTTEKLEEEIKKGL